MGEQTVQSLTEAVSGLAVVLLLPAIALLVLKRTVPVVGDPLWRRYRRLLGWLVVLPVRLVRRLAGGTVGRRRP